MVNIITEDEQHQIAAVGFDPGICPRADALCNRVFLRGDTTVVADASRHPLFMDSRFVTGEVAAVRFYASVPLATDSGFVLGSLCVLSPTPGLLSPEQQAALENIASQVVAVLELHEPPQLLDDRRHRV